MNKLTTIVLGVLALILSMAITAVENSPRVGGAEDSRLLRFDETIVSAVEISGRGETVVLQNIGGFWQFAKPYPDRIHPPAMRSFLAQLNELRVLDRLDQSELTGERSPVNLGLSGKDAWKLTVHHRSKESKSRSSVVLIGNPAPRENSVYASLPGKKKGAFVIDGNPRAILEAPYAALRERQLISSPEGHLVQIALKTAQSEMVLQRIIKDGMRGSWTLVRPFQAAADQEKVQKLIHALLRLQIFEADAKAPPSVQIPEPIPDDALLVQLGVLGSEKPLVLFLKTVPDPAGDLGPPLLSARISDRPAAYLLHSSILNEIPDSAGRLRDRRLGRIPEKALKSIVILTRGKPEVVLTNQRSQGGVSWSVKTISGKFVPANHARITRLIDQMNSPVILDFVESKDFASYGLNPEEMRIGFTFSLSGQPREDGSPAPGEAFERVLRLGWKGEETRRLFANYLNETEVFELDPVFLSAIPAHPIKWRSLRVLAFNPFHVVSIHRVITGDEELNLQYNKVRDSWTGTRNGTNVSEHIDRVMANALRDRLSSFRCRSWNLDVATAYEALKNPTATFTIETSEHDRAVNDVRIVTRKLTLARVPQPNGGVLVFGRIDDNLDVFFVDELLYRALVNRVTGSVFNLNEK